MTHQKRTIKNVITPPHPLPTPETATSNKQRSNMYVTSTTLNAIFILHNINVVESCSKFKNVQIIRAPSPRVTYNSRICHVQLEYNIYIYDQYMYIHIILYIYMMCVNTYICIYIFCPHISTNIHPWCSFHPPKKTHESRPVTVFRCRGGSCDLARGRVRALLFSIWMNKQTLINMGWLFGW